MAADSGIRPSCLPHAVGPERQSIVVLQECDDMKRAAIAAIGIAAILGCARVDPIERVVLTESSNSHFPSGMFKPLRLRATASPQDVVRLAITHHDPLDLNVLSGVTIVTNRTVQICGESYTAALVQRSIGRQQVVLIRYDSNFSGWWSRVYED